MSDWPVDLKKFSAAVNQDGEHNPDMDPVSPLSLFSHFRISLQAYQIFPSELLKIKIW